MAAKPKIKRRVPAVPKRAPIPSRTHSTGVGISVPIYLPVALTPPYTITVLETKVQSLSKGGRKRTKRTDNPRGLDYDDPQPPYDDPRPPYIVKLELKISKGRS